jgi:lactoylglutathione lyase
MPKPVDLSVLGLRPHEDLTRTRSLSMRVRVSPSLTLLRRYPCRTSNRTRQSGLAGIQILGARRTAHARTRHLHTRILAVSKYLHTMLRVTDPERSRAFYEALGMEYRRELPIVRDGRLDATNYFFGFPGQEEELELTFNHDGRSYELGTAYGHIAVGVDDLDSTLTGLKAQGIEPEREPYRVREGGSRLAFVRDPDQYRVELIERK